MISDDLKTFVESAVSVLVGTRDGRLVPECLRAVGARVEPGGGELTVYLPEATCARTLANLADNGRVAVCFCRPADHRSIQVKGALLELREGDAADRARVEAWVAGFADTLAFFGLPRRTTQRLSHWPCRAVRLRVESLFVQTPGPGAGDRLGKAEQAATVAS